MRFYEFGSFAFRELTLSRAERSDQNHLRDVASVTHNDGAFRFIGPTLAELRRTGERECNRTSAQRRCSRRFCVVSGVKSESCAGVLHQSRAAASKSGQDPAVMRITTVSRYCGRSMCSESNA